MDQAPPSAAPFAVVVEDNPVILLHAVDMLEEAGFSVFCSAGSDGALEWLQTHGENIVLLFTNVDIPGPLTGFALAQVAAMQWPHIAIVVTSGKFTPTIGETQSLSQNRIHKQKCYQLSDKPSRSRTHPC